MGSEGLLDCFMETRGLESLKYKQSVAMLAASRGKDGPAQIKSNSIAIEQSGRVIEASFDLPEPLASTSSC